MRRVSNRISKPSMHALNLKEELFSSKKQVKPPSKSPRLGKRDTITIIGNPENPSLITLKRQVVDKPIPSRASLSSKTTTVKLNPLQPTNKLEFDEMPGKSSEDDLKSTLPNKFEQHDFKEGSTSPEDNESKSNYFQDLTVNLKVKNRMIETDMRSKALINVGRWDWEEINAESNCLIESERRRIEKVAELAETILENRKLTFYSNPKLTWLEPTNLTELSPKQIINQPTETILTDQATFFTIRDPPVSNDNDEIYIIVDNQNKDLRIKVHNPGRSLLLSQEQSLYKPSNYLDKNLRSCFFNSVAFLNSKPQDYQNVFIQHQNEDHPSKRHLIKQKNAVANFKLKRTFGISYIKQRESMQRGVQDIFKSIPPIVIQCSTMIQPYQQAERPELYDEINTLLSVFFSKPNVQVNTKAANDETCFRDYLLDLANDDFSRSCLEGMVSLVIPDFSHLKYLLSLNRVFILALPCLIDSIKPVLTMHCKKSMNSKNSYLSMIDRQVVGDNAVDLSSEIRHALKGQIKTTMDQQERDLLLDKLLAEMTPVLENIWNKIITAGADQSDESKEHADSRDQVSNSLKDKEDNFLRSLMKEEGPNFTSFSIKFEMFVPENQWKQLTTGQKRAMTTYMHVLKKSFDGMLLSWNVERQDLENLESCKVLKQLEDVKIFNKPQFYLEGSSENWDVRQFEFEDQEKICDFSSSVRNLPLYTVDTRDCFSYDPIIKESKVTMRGREVTKKEYCFEMDQLPSNFDHFIDKFPDGRIGVVTYENYFSHEELLELERLTHMTELEFFKGAFLPHTGQVTLSGKKVKRTKFFFGSRYMWSAQQLCEPHAHVAGGIRTDVSPIPGWMIEKIEKPLVEDGIIPKDFINSLALNVYHDGEEGLGQHFDDAVRFRQVTQFYLANFLLKNILGCQAFFR